MSTDNTSSGDSVVFRKPVLEDGFAIYELIKRSPPLDLNSAYLYFLQADHFSDTCVVAEKDGQIVGFISAYFKPNDPVNLFVWQVAVDASMRGQRMGSRLLESLVNNQKEHEGFCRISATISPSNIASQKLFARFSETEKLSLEKQDYLLVEHFGEQGHEAEELYTLSAPDNQTFAQYLF